LKTKKIEKEMKKKRIIGKKVNLHLLEDAEYIERRLSHSL